MRFQDKVAIVTGAGRGIGRATALRLASEGATVVVADKVAETAASVVAEIEGAGGKAIGVTIDVTNGEQVRQMVQDVLAKAGKIDILVNNAGWSTVEPFLETSEDVWDRVLNINLRSQMLCSRAVLEHMVQRGGGGKLVNISSGGGRTGAGKLASYCAAKGGVIALSKTLAREMARYNINVNVVCPGSTDTPLFRELHAIDPRRSEANAKLVPLRRVGQPEDIAAAVAFLASADADHITGQTLSVDGGQTMF